MIKIIVFAGAALLVILVMVNMRNERRQIDDNLFSEVGRTEELVADESTELADESAEVVEFDLRASNYKYDLDEIRVNLGDRVKVNLINDRGEHDLVIDEFGVRSQILTGNQTEVIEFVADEAGIFEFYCSVGQHRAMGMVGNLIVE